MQKRLISIWASKLVLDLEESHLASNNASKSVVLGVVWEE